MAVIEPYLITVTLAALLQRSSRKTLSHIACARHFDFSGSVFLENQSLRISARCRGRDISGYRREKRFLRRNSAGVPTDFPCAEYRRKTEKARMMLQREGGILRAMSRRNKGSKKVLWLSA